MFHMNESGCALVLQKDLEYWIIGGWPAVAKQANDRNS